MNHEECLQMVRASTEVRKYVMVQQEKPPSEAIEHNKSVKLKSPVTRILNGTSGTCDRRVLNLKLTGKVLFPQ